jgi:hypothetical protein
MFWLYRSWKELCHSKLLHQTSIYTKKKDDDNQIQDQIKWSERKELVRKTTKNNKISNKEFRWSSAGTDHNP